MTVGTMEPAAAAVQMPQAPVSERGVRNGNGWIAVPLGIAVGVGAVEIFIHAHKDSWLGLAGVVTVLVAVLIFAGLTPVAPGQARVVSLAGRYIGTVRTTGLRWVNPLTARRRVSTRIRNHETVALKVNDADGNPV